MKHEINFILNSDLLTSVPRILLLGIIFSNSSSVRSLVDRMAIMARSAVVTRAWGRKALTTLSWMSTRE